MRVLENTMKKHFHLHRYVIFAGALLVSSSIFAQTDSTDFFYQKGLQEKEKGHKLQALASFEKAAKFDSSNKAVVNELASSYIDLRKYYQAKEVFKRLVAMGDNSAANYKQLLQLSFNLKQQDDVLLYANKLKEKDPSEKINYYIAKVNYDRDNYGDAIKYLNLAAKEDPENGEIPYMIARSYADMMNYKQAIPYFQKAVSLDATKSLWIYEMGLIYYAMNDDKNALKYILEAGEKGYRKDNDYNENLGIAYLNAGNLDEGVKIVGDLLKQRPSDINLLSMVAEAYYYKGKYDSAMNYWDQILGYDKTNATSLYMIGMCYQKKGDKNKGMQLCDKAIEMDPSLAMYKQKKEANF
jgi:tetratricopeptide (TPR) repeat protein